jgi:hypothetical protein
MRSDRPPITRRDFTALSLAARAERAWNELITLYKRAVA